MLPIPTGELRRSIRSLDLVPPMAATLVLVALVGLRGPRDPLTLVAWTVAVLVLAPVVMTRAPVTVFWLVPLSMLVFFAAPVQPYDLVLMSLGALILIRRVGTADRRMPLDRVEIAYLIFLASMGTTLLQPFDLRRLLLAVKLYLFGLLAFEIARRGARWFGRTALLMGPLAFAGITVVMLAIVSHRTSSVTSVLLKHRANLTDLSWGSTNYVAAVLVLVLPGVLYLARDSHSGRLPRRLGAVGVAMVLAGLVLSTSRGGLLLGVAYLALATVGARRGLVAMGAGIAGLAIVLRFTPLGQAVVSRFTDPFELMSVAIRLDIWRAAFERGMAHLPFGVGYGQGFLQMDKLAEYDPHDFYLTLFSEGGPLGLVFWPALIVTLWSAGGNLMTKEPDRAAGQALRHMIVLALINASFEPTFSGELYHVLFWWMAGCFEAFASRGGVRRATEVMAPGGEAMPRLPVPASGP
jgi:O-antigen ligase